MLVVRSLAFVSILYGRRRFLVSVLVAFALQWSFMALFMATQMGQGRLEVVGYIIPGLVANEMDRQGIPQTLLALGTLSTAVFPDPETADRGLGPCVGQASCGRV